MRGRTAGFTLLEMIASLALLAILVTVMLVAFGQGNRSLVQVRDSDRLGQVARSLLDGLVDQRLRAGETRGVVDGDIFWVQRISQLAGEPGQLPIMRIDLQLQGPAAASWHLSSLMVQAPRVAP
jgi:prepilin-type N-terminal cleavage/methylation domain-containing protein